MVQWQGNLEGDVGQKAALLDRIDSFPVPNFFVITPEESSQLFKDVRDHERVLNSQVKGEIKQEVKDAYDDIGMSSEVRNAVGKAKNLVGGQRNNQLVSIRISSEGSYDYELNVGSSNLFRSIKKVAASYYEENSSDPAIIVQKMVDADHSGAAITGKKSILEVVEGLGKSLEEGISTPHLYLLEENNVVDKIKADQQLKLTRNPVNSKEKRKVIEPGNLPFSETKVEGLFRKINRDDLNIKFAFKRGDFHVVDVWREEPKIKQKELVGLRVSEGDIRGKIGRDIKFSDQTIPPSEYSKAIITKRGGYTSRDAEKAREKGKPAVFSYRKEFEDGKIVNISGSSVINEPQTKNTISSNFGSQDPVYETSERTENTQESISSNLNATEVLGLNSRGRGLHLSPPYGPGYCLGGQNQNSVSLDRRSYVDSYKSVFIFDSDKLVLDTRNMGGEALGKALEYLEADLKILLTDEPSDTNLLEKAVAEGFDVFAAPKQILEELEHSVAVAEKRYMLDRLREME